MTTLTDLANVIETRTGLAVHPQRYPDLAPLLQSLTRGDLAELAHHLRSDDLTSALWQKVIRTLAIGETYFFRDPHYRTHLFPRLLQTQRNKQTLTIWCVGCSTGEEVYSIAIALDELLPDRSAWTIRLIGTDISTRALEIARHGIYRPWSFRQRGEQSGRYFEETANGIQVKHTIRDMVTFEYANLLDPTPYTQVDVIFCRNVLLYFAPTRAVRIEAMLHEALIAGGWLVLGASESVRQQRNGWILNQFPGLPVYQKRIETGQLAASVSVAPTLPTYQDAVKAHREERGALTEYLLKQWLTVQPDHAPGWTLLACVYADRQQTEQAHRYLDTAMRLDPLWADAYYLRALVYQEEGNFEEAIQALRAALYSRRDHALGAYLLGILYAGRGEIVRAINLWETAKRIVAAMTPEQRLSDLSDLTAARLGNLLDEQLDGWKG
ncbi:MAG: tetratricopeptide repeat protein [Anaerolineae bacterium]|jgi:chemotaxis protein methyltransferase CheR|nr:tetratricopeptide repeat protein [Anaerolineae bacterium]